MTFTAAQRAELRTAIDTSRREALAESRARHASTSTASSRSAVVRAVEHAQRAQEAKPMMAALVEARPTPSFCVYCGDPAPGGVCESHTDLAVADPQVSTVSNEAGRTPAREARPASSTKGA